MRIDLNCDMGEGLDNDALLMPYISSANIACGYHAGDENTMRRTIELCIQHRVAIGAHPGFADKENFGRTQMQLPMPEIYALVAKQVNELSRTAAMYGTKLRHVKPHGALYNMSAKDPGIATTIAKAVKDIDSDLILFGLGGSCSLTEAKTIGLRVVAEVFADRTYQDDGSLTPRSQSNAMITDEDLSVKQVLDMVQKNIVISTNGTIVNIQPETVCIHGDGEHAVTFAKRIHRTLKENSIDIKSA